jgi:hypothetical protein
MSVDSLKALDPEWLNREADNPTAPAFVGYWTKAAEVGQPYLIRKKLIFRRLLIYVASC